MNDLEFQDLAEDLLRHLEARCDRINDQTDADIDNQRTGGMVTLTFPNRTQIIVNLQRPLHEVWMATRAGGFHYRHDGNTWRDTRQGSEFLSDLTQHASAQSGLALDFS